MKKIILFFLAFPFLLFSQEKTSYFTNISTYNFNSFSIVNTPSIYGDGVTLLKGNVELSDNYIVVNINPKKFPKVEGSSTKLDCYLYDINIQNDVTTLKYKLNENLSETQTRITVLLYNNIKDSSGALIIQAKDTFSGGINTVTYNFD